MNENKAENNLSDDAKDPYDGEYIGNVFGWKISFIGLGVIVFFVVWAAYRHYSLGVPIGFEDPLEKESEKAKYAPPSSSDTLNLSDQ